MEKDAKLESTKIKVLRASIIDPENTNGYRICFIWEADEISYYVKYIKGVIIMLKEDIQKIFGETYLITPKTIKSWETQVSK
jgi:hypothetical protein